ncbi:MAG: type II toxin-antitoxin system VapC family toxin [Chloroflexi bacterium]|nr:type II toxin-antitoxin system VapC family toxin [Chloroflexota bacterium]
MTLVVDASFVAAALTDSGADGIWARTLLTGDDLAAPHLMPVEVANVLRRAAQTGALFSDPASVAHADLLALRAALFPYQPFAARVWELRGSVTPYDAWYVALAESLDAPLATLDRRLAGAPGPRCAFVTPPA